MFFCFLSVLTNNRHFNEFQKVKNYEGKKRRKKKKRVVGEFNLWSTKEDKKMKAPPVRNNLLKMSNNNQLICATLSLIRRIEKLWSELNLAWIKILKMKIIQRQACK